MNKTQPHVLIADDNQHNLDILESRLLSQGYNITLAMDGLEVLEKLQQQPFDLILLDIMMPRMNGYQVLDHLQTDPILRHIPVIVISAINDHESVIKCINLGAADYLTKPFDRTLLKARTTACLEKKRLHDLEQAYLSELQTIQQIDRELNQTLDLNRVMTLTLEHALRHSKKDAGFIGTVENDNVFIVATRGYDEKMSGLVPDQPLEEIIPIVDQAIQTGRIQCLRLHVDTPHPHFLHNAKEQIIAPISRDNEAIGILCLEAKKQAIDTKPIIDFLARLSDHAAIAIANAKLHLAVKEANDTKAEFMSFIAHEMRSPMTAIKGFVELISRGFAGEVSQEQTQFLETIDTNIDRVTLLVKDLTEIARIESGELRLSYEAVPVRKVIDEVRRSHQLLLEEKEQQLSIEINDDLQPILGDYNRQVQILTNLISNAHKYTPQGGLITVSASPIENTHSFNLPTADTFVHIAVQDSGIGIKPEDQTQIFQRFFRSSNKRALAIQGTGLGLNITKHLIELQNGRIWFESEYGKGTTFHYVLPVAG